MRTLADLLGDEMSSLNRFADRMRNSIEDYWRSHHADRPLYTIKLRVKTASSIREKLQKLARDSPDTKRRERARMLLESDDDRVTLEALFATIEDVVGIRVIFLFQIDKKCFFDSLQDPAGLNKWFRVFRKDNGDLNIDEYVLGEDLLALGKINPWMRSKESRYTSSHAVIGFSNDDGRNELQGKFKCELQIRTVIEEAWGELNHFLSYKKAHAEDVTSVLKTAKKHLDGVEESLLAVHREAAKFAQAGQWDPRLQLWKVHERRFPRSLAGDAVDRFNEARELYRQHNFSAALKKFEPLNDYVAHASRELPQEHRVWFKRHIEYNIAITRLCLNERRDIAKAKAILLKLDGGSKTLPPELREPLVPLRLAHIAEMAKDYQAAQEYCRRALEILESSPCEELERVGFMNVDSLKADVTAYWGTIFFRQVEEVVRAALLASQRRDPKIAMSRPPGKWKNIYRQAVSITESALDVAAHARDRVVVERCVNNLLYYSLQVGDFPAAKRWRSKLSSDQPCNPLILDTLGWFEFKCNNDHDKAIALLEQALQIVREREDAAPFISRVRASIERHQKLVKHYRDRGERYEFGEEYESHG